MELELFKAIGQVAGIGGISLGVVLILFRDVIKKNIFPKLTQDQAYKLLRLLIILTCSIGITGIIAWVYPSNNKNNSNSNNKQVLNIDDQDNLLKNGGFEDDYKFWGSGYWETEIYRGSLPPFWSASIRSGFAPEQSSVTNVNGSIDTEIKKSGNKSFKITNNSPLQAHIYGSMSQRITGLQENSNYKVTFWVRAERAGSKTFEITTDLRWIHRKLIESGSYNWQQFTYLFNTGNSNYIDLRFISEEPGTVWVDDIAVKRNFL